MRGRTSPRHDPQARQVLLNVRILHLIPFLWSGAGDVVSRLAISQARRHDVAVVTSGTSRAQRDWPAYRRRLREAGVPWHRVDLFDRSPETLWRSHAALTDLVARWQPEVLHAHAGVPTLAALMASRATHRPRVVSHFYNWGPGRPAWMDAMDTSALRAADAVICSARHYHAWLIARGVDPSRLSLVPWGLDDRWFEPRPTRSASTAPVLGFVGRIEPRKGQLDLVEAFAHLHQRWPASRLQLVGPVADADYAAAIDDAVARAGLGAHVDRLGQVRDARTHIDRWDLFVSLSRDEGQGMAILEAMARGVPVAARLVPGVEDSVVPGVTGLALPSGSARRVSSALDAWLTDAASRVAIARTARAHVGRTATWPRTVRAIEAIYRG